MRARKPSNECQRLMAAFGYSRDGLKAALSHPAFRVEMLALIVMVPLAFVLAKSGIALALLLGSLLLVPIVELLNTGIESAIDRISEEWHPLSKQAKDMGSAAVLLSIFNAGAIWLAVLLY